MTTLPIDAPYDAYDDDAHEDGNVLAGPLSEVFAVDLTVAVATCTGCGSAGPVAGLRVYGRGPGLIARCPDCAHGGFKNSVTHRAPGSTRVAAAGRSRL
ncbi:DUF6510 family protein, partial [Streptomyces sp. NPDC005534]|uniref:DUF6510 family protein n=1 Tax=Streptomyces sp. NPDC005534 TaxID=3155714 RepID=UPI0034541C6E